jgi:hypothetical protein
MFFRRMAGRFETRFRHPPPFLSHFSAMLDRASQFANFSLAYRTCGLPR